MHENHSLSIIRTNSLFHSEITAQLYKNRSFHALIIPYDEPDISIQDPTGYYLQDFTADSLARFESLQIAILCPTTADPGHLLNAYQAVRTLVAMLAKAPHLPPISIALTSSIWYQAFKDQSPRTIDHVDDREIEHLLQPFRCLRKAGGAEFLFPAWANERPRLGRLARRIETLMTLPEAFGTREEDSEIELEERTRVIELDRALDDVDDPPACQLRLGRFKHWYDYEMEMDALLSGPHLNPNRKDLYERLVFRTEAWLSWRCPFPGRRSGHLRNLKPRIREMREDEDWDWKYPKGVSRDRLFDDPEVADPEYDWNYHWPEGIPPFNSKAFEQIMRELRMENGREMVMCYRRLVRGRAEGEEEEEM